MPDATISHARCADSSLSASPEGTRNMMGGWCNSGSLELARSEHGPPSDDNPLARRLPWGDEPSLAGHHDATSTNATIVVHARGKAS